MPRINTGRTIKAEANISERVKRELRQRGWSPAHLAEVMTAAGCKISTTAIYRMIDDDKPRRISFDEVVALAEVFGVAIDELMTPVDLLDKHKAAELLGRIKANEESIVLGAGEYVAAYAELLQLAVFDTDLHDYVMSQLDPDYYERRAEVDQDEDVRDALVAALDEDPPAPDHPFLTFTRELGGEKIRADITTMWNGLYRLKVAMIRQATEVANLTVQDDIVRGRRVDHGEH